MLKKILIGSGFGFLAVNQASAADLASADVIALGDDTVSAVSTVLQATLPTIFALLALLIGAFFVYRLIKKHIGRPR
jgi:hypothetical protein